MENETGVFLDTLFSNKPKDSTILIWSMKRAPNKKEDQKVSRWANSASDARRAVEAACKEPGWDVYAEICTGRKSFGNGRIKIEDAYSLPGVWVDIDIAGVGHKAKNESLPQTIEEALKVVEAFVLKPTMVVLTGGGLHAYFLFTTPLIFESDESRAAGMAIAEQFQRACKYFAGKLGWAIDSTFDLARVLRVPGTQNWKAETPRSCKIHSYSGERYELSQLKAVIPAESLVEVSKAKPKKAAIPKEEKAQGSLMFVMSPDSRPPGDKFLLLCEMETKFEQSTRYDRKDMKQWTPSEYDLSIATYAAGVDWSDQEIVDTIIYCRNKNKKFDPEKMSREKYFRDTIDMARAAVQGHRAMSSLQSKTISKRLAVGTTEATAAPITPEERSGQMTAVSQALGCTFKAVIKYNQTPPQYAVKTSKGSCFVGPVANLINQSFMRNLIAGTDAILIPKLKNDEWEFVAQALLDACEEVDTGPETNDTGAMEEWLRMYFDENRPTGKLCDSSISNQTPHLDTEQGSICFFLNHFRNWLYTRLAERKSAKEIGIILRNSEIGGRPDQVSFTPPNGKKTTRAIYRIPWIAHESD